MRVLFTTPTDIPEGVACRTLKMPNNGIWLGIFNAALLETVNQYNWEQVEATDMTVEDTVAACQAIIDEYWLSDGLCASGCTLPGIDTPPFRLGVNGRFEMLDPETGEWGEPTGEYTIPPTPERDEPTVYERKCAAAANAANVMKELYEAITDEIALGGDTAQVLAAAVAALVTALGGWIAAPVYAIVQLSIALFVGMVELLQVLGGDVWTTEFNDQLECAFLACATDTGDVVTFDLTCIREQLNQPPNLLDPDWFYKLQLFAQVLYLMEVITMDGLNAAGATTGVVSPDCADCDFWCYEVDLKDNDGGFNPEYAGEWESGIGWKAENIVIGTQRTIVEGSFLMDETINITDIGFVYNYHAGTVQSGVIAVGMWIENYATNLFAEDMASQVDGDDLQVNVDDVDLNVNRIDIDLQCSHGAYGGSAALSAMTIHGKGDKPTFLEAMGWTEC